MNNLALMEALKKVFSPRPVCTMDQHGVASDVFEALAFAVMAYETLQGNTSNVPSVTGARHSVVQGMVVPGKKNFLSAFNSS